MNQLQQDQASAAREREEALSRRREAARRSVDEALAILAELDRQLAVAVSKVDGVAGLSIEAIKLSLVSGALLGAVEAITAKSRRLGGELVLMRDPGPDSTSPHGRSEGGE